MLKNITYDLNKLNKGKAYFIEFGRQEKTESAIIIRALKEIGYKDTKDKWMKTLPDGGVRKKCRNALMINPRTKTYSKLSFLGAPANTIIFYSLKCFKSKIRENIFKFVITEKSR